jgi:fumarate reductase subunit D
MRNDSRARRHPAWWAFAVHRLSGVLLALFLPAHFWSLGHALQGAAALDGLLQWTALPVVKFGETAIVVLLAAHMTGGIRLLMIELLAWRDWQKTLLAITAGASVAIGLVFALNVF